jgi:hypothetical protein
MRVVQPCKPGSSTSLASQLNLAKSSNSTLQGKQLNLSSEAAQPCWIKDASSYCSSFLEFLS